MRNAKCIGEYSSYLKRGVVYRYPYPDVSIDVAWLRKALSESFGEIYFSSGEANYKVYSELKDVMENAIKERGAEIHFLTGPIISVPDEITKNLTQQERMTLNPIIQLAQEGKIRLYPAKRRLSKHYRVFKDMKIVSAFDLHDLCERSDNLWLYYGDEIETVLRLEDYTKQISKTKQIMPSDDFAKFFVFLNDNEINTLKSWAKQRKINTINIDIDACKNFLELYNLC